VLLIDHFCLYDDCVLILQAEDTTSAAAQVQAGLATTKKDSKLSQYIAVESVFLMSFSLRFSKQFAVFMVTTTAYTDSDQ
jgi:hypothetical protein